MLVSSMYRLVYILLSLSNDTSVSLFRDGGFRGRLTTGSLSQA